MSAIQRRINGSYGCHADVGPALVVVGGRDLLRRRLDICRKNLLDAQECGDREDATFWSGQADEAEAEILDIAPDFPLVSQS
jgi:hypothetical protein